MFNILSVVYMIDRECQVVFDLKPIPLYIFKSIEIEICSTSCQDRLAHKTERQP